MLEIVFKISSLRLETFFFLHFGTFRTAKYYYQDKTEASPGEEETDSGDRSDDVEL